MTTAIKTGNNTTNIDGFVNFVLTQLKRDAHISKELLQLGTKTGLSQLIESIAADPFSFNIEQLKRNHSELVRYVDLYVLAYLTTQKSLINKLYKYLTATGINYFIILTEDTTENREVFFQLLDHYETLRINAVLPINLSFLPTEVINKMTLPEISL